MLGDMAACSDHHAAASSASQEAVCCLPEGFEISALAFNDIDEAVAFAAKHKVALQRGTVLHPLSTTLRDAEHQLAALAACVRGRGLGHVLWLVMAAHRDDPALTRLLVDKSLLKLASQGLTRFAIRTPEPEADHRFWVEARWRDHRSTSGRRPDGVDRSPMTTPARASDTGSESLTPKPGRADAA